MPSRDLDGAAASADGTQLSETPRRSWSSAVGGGLFILACGFCAHAVIAQWSEVRRAVAGANGLFLLGALSAAVAAMVGIALGWHRCLVAVGARPARRSDVVAWYFTGEVAKYLPGLVWSVVGRGELARRRGGCSPSIAYASVALSLIALYSAPLLPVGLILLHPKSVGTGRRLAMRLMRREIAVEVPALGVTFRLLVAYLPVWFLIAACTVATSVALQTGGSPARLAGATVVAWVAGFAAVPVPAGAGVREVVFTGLSGLPAGVAVTIAIVNRLCFVIADASGALVGAVLLHRRDVAGLAAGPPSS